MGFEGEIKGVPGFPCPGRMTSFLRVSAKNKPLLDGLWIVTAFQANKKLSESGILHFFQVSGRPAGSGSELRWRKACAELQRFYFFFWKIKKKKKTRERHMRVFSLHLKSSIKPGMHLLIALRVVSELDSYPDLLAGWSRMLFHTALQPHQCPGPRAHHIYF